MLRTRRSALGLALLLAAAPAGPGERPPRSLEAGRLGHVRVFEPGGAPASLVFLFSGASGWSAALEDAALEVAGGGSTVVGVDLRQYLAALAASGDGCHYVVAELEELSHRLERELAYPSYRSPILAGVGAGGLLAYAALAQAPAATLAGAVSVDPPAALGTRVPLCPGAPATALAGGGFSYGPRVDLPGWWSVASAQPLPAELAALVRPAADGPDADAPAEQRLVALLRSVVGPGAGHGERELADLPLVELPADRPGPRMAVIYSGDGGWRDLDKQIGEFLSTHGTPVVGIDSLRYFWREKTPDQVALDLARILRHYRERWGTREVILVGYSFGAGVVPFAVNRLPADARATVVQISLLGLGSRAPFEFRVAGWLGGREGAERPVLPEATRLDLSGVQCVHGEQEEDTLCRDPALAGAEIIRTSGGHHFDGDYRALAQRILDGAERRSRAAPAREPPRLGSAEPTLTAPAPP
jgi:type IV secretory pathway VirJ component